MRARFQEARLEVANTDTPLVLAMSNIRKGMSEGDILTNILPNGEINKDFIISIG